MATATSDTPMLIAGEQTGAAGGEWIDVLDPATGGVMGRVPRGTEADVDRAVAASHDAQPAWAALPASERGRVLFEVARRITEDRDALAHLDAQDTGKALRHAYGDADASAKYFLFYAGLADKLRGTTIPLGAEYVDYTVREPFGVSGHIVPWNYPMQLAARGLAPALAAGNGVVVKPAEIAPLSLMRLVGLLEGAGVPAGLVNVVTGYGPEAGAALAAHRGVGQVTFTGSVATGITVARAAAGHVAPVTLELGGKCPNLVFPDADLDAALPVIVNAITQNAGQTCSAATRLIVHESIREELVARVAEQLRAVELGQGVDDPGMGPLISAPQRDKVVDFVDKAAADGATIVTGGSAAAPAGLEGGFFYEATLVDDVRPDSRIAREEVFGPVLAVLPFSSDEEAVRLANDTDYGLVTGIWTRDVTRVHRIAAAVKTGQVFVNGYGAGGGIELPFGGYGASGFGREKGIEGIEAYLQTKNVCIKLGG